MKKQHNYARKLATTAHNLSIVDNGELIATHFDAPSHDEFLQVGALIGKLLHIMMSLPPRFFGNDLGRMGREAGLSPQAVAAASQFSEGVTPDVFARGDLIKGSKGWQLLELNIGSTVGGLFYASLPRLAGVSQDFDVMRSWAEITTQRWNFDGCIALVEDSGDIEYMRLSLPVMAQDLEQASSQKVFVLGHKDLRFDGEKLLEPDGSEIKYIVNLFNEINVVNEPDEYRPILEAIDCGVCKMVMGSVYRNFANKGVLAILHKFANRGMLDPDEAQLVRDFIPTTNFIQLGNFEYLQEKKDSYILKPVNGFGGRGVICGIDTSQKDWDKHLRAIVANTSAYVAQEFIVPETQVIQVTSEDGVIKDQNSRMLWGTFVFGDSYLGSFLRAKPNTGSSIINHANGASIGPLPVEGEWT